MALTITSVQRLNPDPCQHIEVTVNHEGTTRTFVTTGQEIDERLAEIGPPAEQVKLLVILWAAYRRRYSRSVANVGIA